MNVLRSDQKAFQMLGIISSKGDPHHLRMRISQYMCLVTPGSMLLPLIAYFLVNFRNVAEATSAFYLICIIGMASTTYSEYLLKRSMVLSIIQRIQDIVDDSTTAFRLSYQRTESLSSRIVDKFRIFVFLSVFGVVSVPLFVLIILWISNNYSDSMKILPAALL